jgi:hypothetical protein
MNRFEEKIVQYSGEMDRLGITCEIELLRIITKSLGPSIYKVDAETVSGSDERELQTVKSNYLMKRLGLDDGPELDEAIAWVVQTMGRSNRNKYRAIFYYLLVKKLGQEEYYLN